MVTREKQMKRGGEAIRIRRQDKGLTQAQLGEAVGASPQAVGTWENGESEPQPRFRPRLAEALDWPSFSSIYYGVD